MIRKLTMIRNLVTVLEQEEFFRLVGAKPEDRRSDFFKAAAFIKAAGYETMYLARKLSRINYTGVMKDRGMDMFLVGLEIGKWIVAVNLDTYSNYKVGNIYEVHIV